jgi:nucleoside-diphosphate-sugar epimerase
MHTRNRVVVTGGAGYVGSIVSSHLLMNGYDVVVLDALRAGGEAMLNFDGGQRFTMVAGDVRDEMVLARALANADAVVHLAAVVGEPACKPDPESARAIILGGTESVLAAVARHRVPRFVLVSTCSNYGVSKADVIADEDCPLNPLGIYAKSKVEAELLALQPQASASVAVLRLGTICGLSPRMRFDLLVNEMARAAALGDRLEVFGPGAWRPFLHIRDAARAIQCALEQSAPPGSGRVFNVVGENYQKLGLVELVKRHYADVAVDVTDKIPDPRDYRADATRIRTEWGFEPRYTVEDAFLEIASAVRAGVFRNPHWPGHAAAPLFKE